MILKLSCLLLFDLLTHFVMFDVHHSLSTYTSYLILLSGCIKYHDIAGLPRQHSGKESACECREMQETRVRSWGWEDLLEEEMATHSSILAWKILWTEEPGGLQSMGSQGVGHL